MVQCFLDYSQVMGRRRSRVREKKKITHLFPSPQHHLPSTQSPGKLIFNKATQLLQISVLLVYLPCVFFSISTRSPLVIAETTPGVREKERRRQSAQRYSQCSELGFHHSWTAAQLNQILTPALFWIQPQKTGCWSLQENT